MKTEEEIKSYMDALGRTFNPGDGSPLASCLLGAYQALRWVLED